MPSNYDKIIASSPVNAITARQMSGGVHFSPKGHKANVFIDCPKIANAFPKSPSFVNLTGLTVDRLTVLGLSESGSWVCRCVCGRFCLQKTKTIKSPRANGEPHRCEECDYTNWLRSGAKIR